MGAHLLTSATSRTYADHVTRAVEHLARHLDATDAPLSTDDYATIARGVADVDLSQPVDDPAMVLDEVSDLYLDRAVWFHHPRYAAHLNCPVAIPALMAETLVSGVNSSMDTWDQSQAATVIERRLIEWALGLAGLPGGDGVFTSGGTQSNLQALAIARESARRRQDAGARLRVVCTGHTHFSVLRAARLLGLDDALMEVATDGDGRMSPAALEERLTGLPDTESVMAVVATAGTTDLGVIDPLRAVGEVCRRHGVRLHVDAAYGGGLLVSPTRRSLLDGIDLASSVTIDFHKTYFQPVSSSALLTADQASIRLLGHHADYLNPADEHSPDQVDKSLQTTRRFDALKLWFTLRMMGADEIGTLVDQLMDLAEATYVRLSGDPDIEVAAAPRLSTLLLRYAPGGVSHEHGDDLVTSIRAELLASGRAHVARTVVSGRRWLKLTLMNPAMTVDEVWEIVAEIKASGSALLATEGRLAS